jgi:hypothetical protein
MQADAMTSIPAPIAPPLAPAPERASSCLHGSKDEAGALTWKECKKPLRYVHRGSALWATRLRMSWRMPRIC